MMENSEWMGKIIGIASLLLFVVANAYYPARLIANQYRPWSMDVAIVFKKYSDIHMWLNVIAFMLMAIQAYITNDSNIFLYASILVTVWLTVAGLLKRSRRFSRDTRKQMRLLQTQQTIFVVWLVLLLWGIL